MHIRIHTYAGIYIYMYTYICIYICTNMYNLYIHTCSRIARLIIIQLRCVMCMFECNVIYMCVYKDTVLSLPLSRSLSLSLSIYIYIYMHTNTDR